MDRNTACWEQLTSVTYVGCSQHTIWFSDDIPLRTETCSNIQWDIEM